MSLFDAVSDQQPSEFLSNADITQKLNDLLLLQPSVAEAKCDLFYYALGVLAFRIAATTDANSEDIVTGRALMSVALRDAVTAVDEEERAHPTSDDVRIVGKPSKYDKKFVC